MVILAGCGGTAPPTGAGGDFEISWTGVDTGTIAVPGRAEWCAGGRLLEIVGLSGDTGAAIVLYPVDSIEPDSMPVRAPGVQAVRPEATMALRIFGEAAVLGFRGYDGMVLVEESGQGRISGRFEADMRGVREVGEARVEGSFSGIPVRSSNQPCTADTTSILGDTALR